MELVDQESPMTIHHLLTHTAGLSYGFFFDNPIEEMYRNAEAFQEDTPLEDKIKSLAQIPLLFQPGTRWNYSYAVDVCAYLAQLLSDMPYEVYLQENILDPLGMVDTQYYAPEDKLSRLAVLYEHNFMDGSFHIYQGAPDIPLEDYTLKTRSSMGGHGLVATVEDYLKFALMLLNKGELDGTRILGRKTLEYMTTNHLKPELLPFSIGDLLPINGAGFGLGFEVIMDPAQSGVMNSVGNFGWVGAAATNFWVDPQEELIGIIMTQLMHNMLPFQSDFRVLTYQALID